MTASLTQVAPSELPAPRESEGAEEGASEARIAVTDRESGSVIVDEASLRAADGARSVDLEAHLASIGRVSAGLTHELRSPLCTIQLALESIGEHLDGELPREEAMGALADASAAVLRIEGLLVALGGLVRTRADSPRLFDLVSLARAVQRSATSAFPGVTFELAAPPDYQISCDELRLRQIVENLVANAAQAVAASARPRVRLHVYTSRGCGVLSVRDNGPGIAAEEQEKIFDPFYTTRREAGGTGLGLALCREYAMQMGIDLSLESAPARGACFRIRIPG